MAYNETLLRRILSKNTQKRLPGEISGSLDFMRFSVMRSYSYFVDVVSVCI